MKSQIPELKTHFIFALPHSIRAESNRQLPLTYKMHSCQGDHWCLRKLPLPSLERNQFSLLPGCNIFSVNLQWVESKVKVWDYKFLLPEGIAQVFLLCIVSSLITAVTWGVFFTSFIKHKPHTCRFLRTPKPESDWNKHWEQQETKQLQPHLQHINNLKIAKSF